MLRRLHGICLFWIVTWAVWPSAVPEAAAETRQASLEEDALLVSDIHFDPFVDASRVSALAAAPVAAWRGILDGQSVAANGVRPSEAEKACRSRGPDTSEALLVSSMKAIRAEAHGVRFATIAGDLLAHNFDCKFAVVFPHASQNAYRDFAIKTMEYVILQLRATLPGVPVYPALGNNDSGCGDYLLDPDSPFLAASAAAFVADVPKSERRHAQSAFAAHGGYTTTLPDGHGKLRLVAIDNLFESKKYAGCNNKPNPQAARGQLAWLKGQLDQARARGERVWLVGHIPPGVDPYSTALHLRNICSGDSPEYFLSGDALPALLGSYGDVIRLAIFSHTHMDEMRLIPANAASNHGPVPVKMIPSISPINGNLPSFTVATLNIQSGILDDYRVVSSSDAAGSGWTESYRFRQAYGKPAFTAATVSNLMDQFHADPAATGAASKAYLRGYTLRGGDLLMSAFWQQYTCSLANMTSGSYRSCRCQSTP